MKKIILELIIVFLSLSVYSQKVFMYGENGEKVYFQKTDSLVQIKFGKNISNNEQLNIFKTINPDIDISVSKNNRLVIPEKKGKHPNYIDLNKNASIKYANQSLMDDVGIIQIPTDKVLVKIKNDNKLGEILEELDIEYETYKSLGHDKNSYLIILKNGESLNTANTLYESGYFKYAQPSFTRFIEMMNANYPDQWGLNNTGQNGGTVGIDINAPEAWGITTGCEDIVVAVIDQGVDLDHPDLDDNLLTGYDATDGGGGGANGDCWGDDAHGTCCAGIIGARDNTIGTIGVAPDCSILPIRVSYELNGIEIWDDDWVIDAINYAWEVAGADILSCSWHYTNVTAISNEISDALNYGRNNLGCVVVFAAGNNNSSVSYPANNNSDIIAVGAMSPCGERKRSSSNWWEVNYGVSTDPNGVSCDNETWWGSNYGNELDLVAPGVFIPTTDIQDSSGYNTATGTDGDYYLTFNGTSAATPHVAGVAALILSVNPDLMQDEVRDIIESTCTKVGSYSYSTTTGRTNGTWDDEVGYGCVNAHAALLETIDQMNLSISGPSLICSSDTFTANNPPEGINVVWNAEPQALFQYKQPGTTQY